MKIKNKKGQLFFFTLMLATVVIILTLALAPAILTFTSDARNATINGNPALDCNNNSISDFDNAACIVTDLTLPYFLGIMIAIAGAMIGARLIVGG